MQLIISVFIIDCVELQGIATSFMLLDASNLYSKYYQPNKNRNRQCSNNYFANSFPIGALTVHSKTV